MEEQDRADQFERGRAYLDAAKRLVPIARRLDADDAATVRRLADQLTETGLDLLLTAVGGAKKRRRRSPEEMAAARGGGDG